MPVTKRKRRPTAIMTTSPKPRRIRGAVVMLTYKGDKPCVFLGQVVEGKGDQVKCPEKRAHSINRDRWSVSSDAPPDPKPESKPKTKKKETAPEEPTAPEPPAEG